LLKMIQIYAFLITFVVVVGILGIVAGNKGTINCNVNIG